MITWDDAELRADLVLDEGERLALYYDSEGVPTIGVGHNLKAKGVTPAVSQALYQADVLDAIALLDADVPWWRDLPDRQQRVMVNLSFQLGERLMGFVHFLAAMQRGDWPAAAAELRDSRWWGQVGERGPRTVARLLDPAP